MILLFFVVYLILISWLTWWINRPKFISDSVRAGDVVYNQAVIKLIDSAYTVTLGADTGFTADELKRVAYLLGCTGIKADQVIRNLKNAIDENDHQCECEPFQNCENCSCDED